MNGLINKAADRRPVLLEAGPASLKASTRPRNMSPTSMPRLQSIIIYAGSMCVTI